VAFREVVVLRELEGLSYKEIARLPRCPWDGDVPFGPGRTRLQEC